ncbi:hypothetical protein ACJQWK_11090 [Exserohilum turcicum]|uniref:Uncharacterized protein n=1 Tax=Exserohilum turcicum (strain 28A) TaxID=671987 RepID=R0I700_EXST2|nr:uncharacterized protein SETTUDRAFT_142590 [Exserohilum turcica Et28A]EOA81251.1 hypothetical protein SETTUDRAFT_142590 [Exserohilum turcica Et28A]
MAASGSNLAVTKDGEAYNKLSRPDGYLTSTQPPLPSALAPSPAVASSKRKYEQENASETKRARIDRNGPRSKGQLRAHEQFREPGVRSALPGLDGEEQLSDESIDEAVAYLRSVRSEASTIPTLLTAPNNPHGANRDHGNAKGISTNKYSGSSRRVVYNDGTWVALESEGDGESEYWDEDADYLDPQESSQWALVRRFCNLRSKLSAFRDHKPLPTKTMGPRKSRRSEQSNKYEWAETIDRGYPELKEITQLDEPTLYVALHGCTLALDRSTEISRQKSCWIWTLLALTGDFGTLDHERIGKIRDLGLAASRLAKRLQAERSSKEQSTLEAEDSVHVVKDTPDMDSSVESGEAVDDSAEDSGAEMVISEDEAEAAETAEVGDLETARARLLAQLGDRLVHSEVPSSEPSSTPKFHMLSRAEAERQRQEMRNQKPQKEHSTPILTPTSDTTRARNPALKSTPLTESELETKAAIDMILTVVAECYGQKDLFNFIEAW